MSQGQETTTSRFGARRGSPRREGGIGVNNEAYAPGNVNAREGNVAPATFAPSAVSETAGSSIAASSGVVSSARPDRTSERAGTAYAPRSTSGRARSRSPNPTNEHATHTIPDDQVVRSQDVGMKHLLTLRVDKKDDKEYITTAKGQRRYINTHVVDMTTDIGKELRGAVQLHESAKITLVMYEALMEVAERAEVDDTVLRAPLRRLLENEAAGKKFKEVTAAQASGDLLKHLGSQQKYDEVRAAFQRILSTLQPHVTPVKNGTTERLIKSFDIAGLQMDKDGKYKFQGQHFNNIGEIFDTFLAKYAKTDAEIKRLMENVRVTVEFKNLLKAFVNAGGQFYVNPTLGALDKKRVDRANFFLRGMVDDILREGGRTTIPFRMAFAMVTRMSAPGKSEADGEKLGGAPLFYLPGSDEPFTGAYLENRLQSLFGPGTGQQLPGKKLRTYIMTQEPISSEDLAQNLFWKSV
jgi:hypothetical protein